MTLAKIPTYESLQNLMYTAYYAAIQADDAFRIALQKKFGPLTGDMRYKSKSWFDSSIDAAFEAKCAADEAYRQAVAEFRQYY